MCNRDNDESTLKNSRKTYSLFVIRMFLTLEWTVISATNRARLSSHRSTYPSESKTKGGNRVWGEERLCSSAHNSDDIGLVE